MRYKILSAIALVGLIPTFYGLSSVASTPDNIKYFISDEVKPCLTSGGNAKACDIYNPAELLVVNMTHNLRNNWVSHSLTNCSEIPTRGNYIDGSTVEFLTPTNEKVVAKISLRDISVIDSQNNSMGVLATTQGSLNSTIGSTMQDSSPKPITWMDLPYWTENVGSSLEGNRNAVLFEFFDSAGFPTEVASFGAWFGDLEARSDVHPATIITYDRNGNPLAPKVDITENIGTDLSKCGSSTSLGQGCGNQTTRWIGFTDVDTRNVQKVLVTVGEDDIGGDGSREHLSFTGPTIIRNFGCVATSTPTLVPTMTETPTAVPTNTPLPSPTYIPTATPTSTILPSPTFTPMPSSTIKPTTTQSPRSSSTPTPTAKHTGSHCCDNKPNKKILTRIIKYLIKLVEVFHFGKFKLYSWHR
jgi:hypothetical protein